MDISTHTEMAQPDLKSIRSLFFVVMGVALNGPTFSVFHYTFAFQYIFTAKLELTCHCQDDCQIGCSNKFNLTIRCDAVAIIGKGMLLEIPFEHHF